MESSDKLLVNLDDIKGYHPVANIPTGRLDPVIREVQFSELKRILGPALYLDFMKNHDDSLHAMYADYQKLLVGDEYVEGGVTKIFEGIKPVICYYVIAELANSNDFNINSRNLTKKISNNSESVNSTDKRSFINSKKSVALRYEFELVEYICDRSDIFLLYNQLGKARNKQTSFNMFKL